MTEEQVVAAAQQQVAARRTGEIEQCWGGSRRWLPPALVVAVLLAFLAAPGWLPRKLLLAMGGVCSLRTSHSYFASGVQLPLESRTTGIYAGFLLTLVLLLFGGRFGARRLGTRFVLAALALMFGSMAFDGINSTLFEVGLPALYTPSNPLRLATGLLSGIAIAPFMIWLWGVVAAPDTEAGRRPVVRSLGELAAPLALNAGFALLVVGGRSTFYYPVALISVAGVVALLAGGAFLPVLMLGGLEQRVTRLRQVIGPVGVATLLALAVLALTATLRWTATGMP